MELCALFMSWCIAELYLAVRISGASGDIRCELD